MESPDGRYAIVFNGEIYNHADLRPELSASHHWRGTSDTETLLAAYRRWGVHCLDRINGMFAFAIWDRHERTLFVARDRMGVKPLYYFESNGRFGFASRPAPLMRLLSDGTLGIDPEALRVYFELGYIPAPLSFHRGIRKLSAAHYLLINAAGVRNVRYWDFRPIGPDPSMSARPEAELVEELDSLIRSAVKDRLMSDVPLGAFLSGGIDSSLVVAAMKAVGVVDPKAFTIGFHEKAYDESSAAREVAKHLGVDHIDETLDVDSLLGLMPEYVEQFDEPFADSSAFPTMAVARLARKHVTVSLSGDGADEIFGGYHYFGLMNNLSRITRLRPKTKKLVRALLTVMPFHRAKLLAGAVNASDVVSLFHYLRGVGKDYPAIVDQDIMRSTPSSDTWFEQYAASFAVDLTAAETGMRLDAGFTLPDFFLQKVDVATMAFSLEARCPFTDYRLVEWAMRLPVSHKIRGRETKYLLKKVLCKYLPSPLVYRPKRGFSVPIAQWLRGPLREWARERIYDDRLMSQVPLNKDLVRELLHQQLTGKRESHPLIWSVLMLLCFVQRHQASALQTRPVDLEVA